MRRGWLFWTRTAAGTLLALACALGAAPPVGAAPHRSAPAARAHAAYDNRLYFAEGYTGQGAAVRFAETLDLLNTNPFTATGQLQYFLNSGLTSTVPITIPARARLSEDVVRDVGPDRQVSTLVASDRALTVTRTIARSTAAGASLAPSVSIGDESLSQSWYFAEGYTGASFQEYLSLFNPGDLAVHVTMQPAGDAGAAPLAPLSRMVPPHSRVTVNLRAALPHRAVSLVVQGDRPLAAERTLYWGAGSGSAKFGASVSTGIKQPGALWLFPYASIGGGDQVFLSVNNPTSVQAQIRITYYDDSGSTSSPLSAIVQPGTRSTLSLPQPARARGPAVSMTVSSDVPVVCEEAQYYGGSPNVGMHAGSIIAGAGQPATRWVFSGVDTAPYTTERWQVLNTGSLAARITATLYSVDGQPSVAHFAAGAGKLTSISMADIRDLQNASASMWVSDRPVTIVEVLRGADASTGVALLGSAKAP